MRPRKFLSKKPAAIYKFRYERNGGQAREISVPVGFGRLRRGRLEAAREIAERRLDEQYGDMSIFHAEQINNYCLVVDKPDLHQSNYRLVGVKKV